MKSRLWLVEMRNKTDSRDDEVWKVRAANRNKAAALAQGPRFDTGRVVPARGGSSRERAIAREFRTYCTKVL